MAEITSDSAKTVHMALMPVDAEAVRPAATNSSSE